MKKGFMLLETLVVSMFVMSVLIFLYMQFTTIYSNYERDVTYNSTNDMYALNTFRDYLLQDGLDEAKQALYNSESNYIWIYDEECGDYFSSTEYCNNLLGKLNLKKVLFTKENLKELNKELDNDIANKTLSDKFDRKLINYIKTISYIGEATTHRLIGEFNDGTYATINVLNASSNNIADYTVPVISGADDIEVPAWHAFDAEAGVTAIDDIDGDITGKIKIEGEVNPQIVGEYELTYTVEDSSGNVAIKKRKVTVVKAEYVDDSGAANPNLKGKLVPVTIEDNGTVKKADITTKWFDYDEKKWANAVILDDNIIPDVSGNKNHGYLQNGTTRNDGSVTTDGVDDYIYAGLMDHEFQNELSIVLRVKLNSKVNHDLFDNVEVAGMSLFVRDDYKFAFNIYSNSKNAYYGIHANEVYELNKWYTIVGTFKDNKLHLYINGKEAATPVEFTGATDIKNSMTAFLIGSNPYGKNHCNSTNHTCGNMANLPLEFTDALIFDRALSTDEIASEFSGKITNVSNTSKMILRYELDDPIPNNTVLPEEVIESYFVWIPKYKYKLWNLGNYSNADGTATTGSARNIEITFDKENTKDINGVECIATNKSGDVGECNVNEWMTHPAFISFDVDGFWAGKFETGYKGSTSKETAEVDSNDSTKVIVKPSTNSWRYIIIKNMFEASYNYERALDSHMMKNTEFGAIAYLSHSKYGIGKEVNINNNSKYITGCGATPGSVASDTCNNYTTVLGMGASTTGNIYGIYDLSGGAFEYAASYLENQYNDSVFDATSIAKYESKYFDVYKKSAINSRTDYTGRILGDSTGELGPFKDYRNSWYSDHANFPSVDSTYRNPWFGRGGSYSSAIEAGQFAFNWGSGGHDKNNSFFIALAPQ